jgi:hypothetical protein
MTQDPKRNNGPSDSSGIVGQMSRLKAHSGASAGELREFVRTLRGRSPQEVIGVLAQSNLVRATMLAAAGTFVLMLVFTVLPAVMADKPKPADAKPAPVAAPPTPTPTATDAKTASKDAASTPTAPKAKDKADALDKLGIGETKTSDPKKNPLDNTGDDLFKDVK